LKRERHEKEVKMAEIRETVIERAEQIQLEEKARLSKKRSDVAKDVVFYEDSDKTRPLTTTVKDSTDYLVYVPCYDLYRQHFLINQNNTYKILSESMNEDEIIAYIFLTDLEKIASVNGLDTSSAISERILKLFEALEEVSHAVSDALKHPIETELQYITFPDKDTIERGLQDVAINKDVWYEAYNTNNFETLKVTNDYAYYIFELLYNKTRENEGETVMFETLRTRFENVISTNVNTLIGALKMKNKTQSDINNAQRLLLHNLITYLNLPESLQNNKETQSKYVVASDLITFTKRHPIFSTIYLNYIGGGKEEACLSKNMSASCNPPEMLYKNVTSLLDLRYPTEVTYGNLKATFLEIEQRFLKLKQLYVHLYMVNLYFNHYRDSMSGSDNATKVDFVNEGFVDLYRKQIMSPTDFFFNLITPFKEDLLDGRVKALWRRTFQAKMFNLLNEQGYWGEFRAFWIGYLRPRMNALVKGVWKKFASYAKPRWK
jgi:hypothetical protein